MKILKKSLALFLVVALAASAFCLEAFAESWSRYVEGTNSNNKYWSASLYGTVRSSDKYLYATANFNWQDNDRIRSSIRVEYKRLNNNYYTGAARLSSSVGKHTAKITSPARSGCYVSYAYAQFEVEAKTFKTLSIGTPF